MTEESKKILLQMNPEEFDVSPISWRSLSALKKHIEAADLIKEYINTNKERVTDIEIMYFHIGQLLAFSGTEHYSEAIEFFKLSFFLNRSELWNTYVSATIAFLEGNIKKIEESIQIIENSKKEDKRQGNLGIIKNFQNSLLLGEKDYGKAYILPRD